MLWLGGGYVTVLVSSLNIGCCMDDAFKNKTSTKMWDVKINSPTFMDDISNMGDNLKKAREALGAIHGVLLDPKDGV